MDEDRLFRFYTCFVLIIVFGACAVLLFWPSR